MKSRTLGWVALACGAAPVACATVPTRPQHPVELCRSGPTETIILRYIGSGGFLMQLDDEAILTAPFLSNPQFLRVFLGMRVAPNPNRIADHLGDVSAARAILVGHSHYDHLMDVPLIVPQIEAQAKVWGSTTMTHLLDGLVDSMRTESVNARAGNDRRPGSWIHVGGRIRFMALHSAHAPNFLGKNFAPGKLDRPPPHPPRKASDWKEGQPFAFLIDFLRGDGSPMLRIHYQDAASDPPYGFPPRVLIDSDPVDVTIVCVGAFAEAQDYPEGLLRDLEPRHVVMGHWEDFFRDPAKPPREIPFTDRGEFIVRMESALPSGAKWSLAQRDQPIEFRVCR